MSEHKEEEALRHCGIIAKHAWRKRVPWDKEQTFESLKPCMVNEMTEALAGSIFTHRQEMQKISVRSSAMC